jgi:hypothetical protein
MILSCQVVMQGESNLSKDQYVNTWHFSNGDIPLGEPTPAAHDAIRRLADFYCGEGDTGAVGRYLSGGINRTVTVKVYRLGDPKPRPIVDSATFDLPTANSANSLPAEVACCLSYYSGRNIVSSRGRVFLGPFTTSAASTGHVPRPDAGFKQVIKEAAGRLIAKTLVGAGTVIANELVPGLADIIIPDMVWALWSPTHNVAKEVTSGWIDDAFDTQRRRGALPTSRIMLGP